METSIINNWPSGYELNGYDPVVLKFGPPGLDCIVEGKPEITSEYDGRIFSFATVENLQKFMKNPHQFVGQTIPRLLPPKNLNTAQRQELGNDEYLKLTLSGLLTVALQEIGGFKPKHPFMTAVQSGQMFLYLFLKANNPNLSQIVRKEFKEKFEQFKRLCGLVPYLTNNVDLSKPTLESQQESFKSYYELLVNASKSEERTK